MAAPVKIVGIEQVLRNLNHEVGRIKWRTMTGLMEAGLKVQGSAQGKVPIDTGNLRASAFTRKHETKPLAVVVGFTSAYAVFVHENLEQKLKGQPRRSGTRKGRYWDPQGRAGPKFLQRAVGENTRKIVAIIQHHAKVPR
jgi:hypothetical protein